MIDLSEKERIEARAEGNRGREDVDSRLRKSGDARLNYWKEAFSQYLSLIKMIKAQSLLIVHCGKHHGFVSESLRKKYSSKDRMYGVQYVACVYFLVMGQIIIYLFRKLILTFSLFYYFFDF